MVSFIRNIFLGLAIAGGCATVQAQVSPDTVLAGDVAVAPIVDTNAVGGALVRVEDTVGERQRVFQPNPKKAALYSGIFPGLGHAYIRQYWKLPIVYAGAGAAAYFITLNLDKYRTYRKAYIARLSGQPDDFDYLTDADLQVLQDGYKRNLDMAVLFSALGYTVQVLDALAAAHLKNFDISDDISFRLQPIGAPNGGVGFGLAVHFR